MFGICGVLLGSQTILHIVDDIRRYALSIKFHALESRTLTLEILFFMGEFHVRPPCKLCQWQESRSCPMKNIESIARCSYQLLRISVLLALVPLSYGEIKFALISSLLLQI